MTEGESQIPPEFIRQCFEVSADGVLLWKKRDRAHFRRQTDYTSSLRRAGQRAGTNSGKGYIHVGLVYQGKTFILQCHRIAWLLHTGNWPEQHIDHINRIRDDNRPENLRDVSPEENLKNNGKQPTGLTGAFRRGNRFFAKVQRYQKPERYLGMFATAEEAHAAYLAAKEQEKSAVTTQTPGDLRAFYGSTDRGDA